MPNYVLNKMKVQGEKEKVKELFDFIKAYVWILIKLHQCLNGYITKI